MGNTDGSAFRRMLRRLTSDVDELDAENLSGDAERSGAQRAAECACGQEVTVLGRLRSVEYGPQDGPAFGTLQRGESVTTPAGDTVAPGQVLGPPRPGRRVVFTGDTRPAAATLEAELFDGTEGVTLIWLGRRRIPGIEPGRTMRVRGRIALREGRKVLYNPYYEICPST